MTNPKDKIRWRDEWELKTVEEVQEFLDSIKGKLQDELSEREWRLSSLSKKDTPLGRSPGDCPRSGSGGRRGTERDIGFDKIP